MSLHTSGERAYPRYLTLPCALGGALLLAAGALRILGLARGTPPDRLLVLAAMLALAALAVLLLGRRGWGRERLLLLLLPVGLAFFLRAVSLDYSSLDYQDFLSQWAAFFRDNGGFAAVREPVGNYNAPYLYFMAAISYLPAPDLYLIKLFSILFDVLLAWGGVRLARIFCGEGSPAPALCGCLLLLLPTVVLNGAFWGQCDSLYGSLVVHALACALNRRPGASVVLLAVAFSFKLQTIFLLPLWGVLWLAGRVRFSRLWLFPLTYTLTILPALLLGKPLADTLGVYLGQMGINNELSFNAPSVFQFLPYGVPVDAELAAGAGIAAAFLLVLLLLGLALYFRDRLDDGCLLSMAVVMAIGVPFLLPHMHDRYFFLADVLTLIWACTGLRRLPQAALVELASLSAYCTYLRMRYTCPVRLGRHVFAMGLETAMVLAALLLSAWALAGALRALPERKKPRNGRSRSS